MFENHLSRAAASNSWCRREREGHDNGIGSHQREEYSDGGSVVSVALDREKAAAGQEDRVGRRRLQRR
jgi:hypothetical protein